MNNFRPVQVKDLGRVVTGKTPSTKDLGNFSHTGYMFITPSELHQGYLVKKSAKYLTADGLKCIKNNTVSGVSVAVGCIGWDMGNVALLEDTCATNQQINTVTDILEDFNPLYIYYWFRTKKEYLRRIASVTRTPILNKTTFEKILIPIPSRKNQDKIADILTSLDNKIAHNKKINAEIERVTQVIYDFWFAQYDFPDEHNNSSGGNLELNSDLRHKIPHRWKAGALDDLASITGGSTPTTNNKENFSKNGMAWITPNDLSDNVGNKYITKGKQDVTEQGIRDASLRIYPAGTVLLSSRAPIGYMSIARGQLTTNQGFKSFVPNKGYPTEFVYYAVRSQLPAITQYSSGSTFKEISGTILKTIKISLPPKEIAEKYADLVRPMFERQNLIEQQNEQLEQLRDWLLPMLMNGQVTVAD